jgi:multisubunit Na+/H+ antiporter MnhC subunit
MTLALAVAVGAAVTAGVFLLLSRDVLRIVVGVSLVGLAANLILFGAGRPKLTSAPPIVSELAAELPAHATNPLPQALVLTAIVIGFALTCFSLVLVLALKQSTGSSDGDGLRAAEPPPGPDGKPPLLEEEK